ncbi:MAG: hypothetical protein A2W93_07420 [Bacteroidetes bacterium GWF2_43_63]|nr:MAG: hypothetical protein A2W94_15490 [Bacteroidetes bacterium GWE2_42_42]OFY54055.1 MAG: hypothetical protein A2W93_07420 [Bacteroidetes bacterium GWF2_43_63]HCB63533.1 hypothetical protein [Bacteroidales bacterium]HCY23221.1 hypothetical protein [Bacteroidales bacterium]
MRNYFLLLILTLLPALISAQVKNTVAVRTIVAPVIDGDISDDCWNISSPADKFLQKSPFYNQPATQQSEVRVLFDDNGIYFAIRCYDSASDSILRQLGTRDEDLNADRFNVKIDPYNNHLDAYVFGVYASGPQADSRFQDAAFNAVWKSESKIDDKGWTSEMFIPYSALRFPKSDVQLWGIQFERLIRRSRETSQWALEEQNASNVQLLWGTLSGIQGIDPPVRLSLNPYVSASVSHFPHHDEHVDDYSRNFGGGLDLKAGLSESYTIDMTLLPDFSQVQSDDIINNLSAFETQYEEQRMFFKEAVDLFQKGNLFYSRRIGRMPRGFFDIYSQLDSGETVISNPSQSQLVNASKISGRGNNGLAVGFFNAVTRNTYAEIRTVGGDTRRVLTEPFANYNILVVDKEFKNSNSFYIINNNALRERVYQSSNVTGAGTGIFLRKKTFKLSFNTAVTQNDTTLFSERALDRAGLAHATSFSKVRGNWTWTLGQSTRNSRFDYDDMGIMSMNNYQSYTFSSAYAWYNPATWLKEIRMNNYLESSYRLSTGRSIGSEAMIRFSLLTMKHHFYIWGGYEHSLTRAYNYYESRNPEMPYYEPHWSYAYLGFSSSYSKPFALDGDFSFVSVPYDDSYAINIALSPFLKIGNRFQLRYEVGTENTLRSVGYAGTDTLGMPLFGVRDVVTVNNTLSLTYVIRNYMPITLRVRHYYNEGRYDRYMTLDETGEPFIAANADYNHDFTFNAFNVDFVYSWQFSPGSSLSLIWKTGIQTELLPTHMNYLQNFRHTLDSDQFNSLTLKVIYYLDYQQVRKHKA